MLFSPLYWDLPKYLHKTHECKEINCPSTLVYLFGSCKCWLIICKAFSADTQQELDILFTKQLNCIYYSKITCNNILLEKDILIRAFLPKKKKDIFVPFLKETLQTVQYICSRKYLSFFVLVVHIIYFLNYVSDNLLSASLLPFIMMRFFG